MAAGIICWSALHLKPDVTIVVEIGFVSVVRPAMFARGSNPDQRSNVREHIWQYAREPGISGFHAACSGSLNATQPIGVMLEGRRMMACEALVQASVLSRLSGLAYTGIGKLPDGYRNITLAPAELTKIGLQTRYLQRREDHFRSRVYVSDGPTGLHYVVAFGGTDPGSFQDDTTDIAQFTGLPTREYKDAA